MANASVRRQLAGAADEPESSHLASPGSASPALPIVTWVLLAVDVFVVAVQFLSFRGGLRVARKTNTSSFCALLLCIAQGVAVSLQTHYGFGRHANDLSSHDLQLALKSQYAGELFYVLAIPSAKLSLIMFLLDVNPAAQHSVFLWTMISLTCVWTVSSIFVVALQCNLPHTWNLVSGQCIDFVAFWTFYGAVDIFTNAILTVFSVCQMFRLCVSAWRKVKLSTHFAVRVLAIIATAVQVTFLREDVHDLQDITHNLVNTQIISQVVLTTSLAVSAVPLIRPFMSSLESGMIRVDHLRRLGRQETYGNTAFYTSRRPAKAVLADSGPEASVPVLPSQAEVQGVGMANSRAELGAGRGCLQ